MRVRSRPKRTGSAHGQSLCLDAMATWTPRGTGASRGPRTGWECGSHRTNLPHPHQGALSPGGGGRSTRGTASTVPESPAVAHPSLCNTVRSSLPSLWRTVKRPHSSARVFNTSRTIMIAYLVSLSWIIREGHASVFKKQTKLHLVR